MLLNEMEIFFYVVELNSFSNAAEKLEVSKSFISKRITKLEQDLKIRLLSRSTRKLTLTEAGKNFYRSCARVVQEGNRAYSMMSELQGKPSGVLKISIPPALGLHLLAPVLSKFLQQFPEVSLNIELENKLIDLIKGGYDLALRSAKLESSNFIAQKIFTFHNKICASKTYLKNHSALRVPNDLQNHNCATYSAAKSANPIKIIKHHHEETIFVQGNFFCNHLSLIKQMVLNDLCIGILPNFMVDDELRNKQLVHCLPEYQLAAHPIYAIFPEREFMLPKVKCFLDMLKEHLRNKK